MTTWVRGGWDRRTDNGAHCRWLASPNAIGRFRLGLTFNATDPSDRVWSTAVTTEIRPLMAALPRSRKIAAIQEPTPFLPVSILDLLERFD
ncbi:hypothetical protein, partial [Erythrobacter donghaensis]